MVWMAAFAMGALAQTGPGIAGVVSVSCAGSSGLPRPKGAPPKDDVWVALDPATFRSYLKAPGNGLVFHFHALRNGARGTESKFTIAGPSTQAKWGFALRRLGAYELVITDLPGATASKTYALTLQGCP